MRAKANDKKISLFFYGFIVVFLGAFISIKLLKSQSLKNNYKITNALVYAVNPGSPKGGNIVVKFTFIADGKEYDDGIDIDLSYSVKEKLMNRTFPLAYDSTKPSNNKLLIFSSRWERLGLQFPDSLKWIKRYYL